MKVSWHSSIRAWTLDAIKTSPANVLPFPARRGLCHHSGWAAPGPSGMSGMPDFSGYFEWKPHGLLPGRTAVLTYMRPQSGPFPRLSTHFSKKSAVAGPIQTVFCPDGGMSGRRPAAGDASRPSYYRANASTGSACCGTWSGGMAGFWWQGQ